VIAKQSGRLRVERDPAHLVRLHGHSFEQAKR
jgi:hypothetical protein